MDLITIILIIIGIIAVVIIGAVIANVLLIKRGMSIVKEMMDDD